MNSTTAEPNTTAVYQLPFDETGIIVVASSIFFLCFFGTVANIITIVVITISPKLKTTFYILILSLSISDLVASVISPFYAYRITWGFEYWEWSDGLCKVLWATDIWTAAVTALHILMFSAFRFISIQWPHRYSAFTTKRTKIGICAAWAVTFLSGFVPSLTFFGAFKRTRGSDDLDSNFPSCSLDPSKTIESRVYTKTVYTLFFYIPFFLIMVFSIGIAVKLHLMRKKRSVMKGKDDKSNLDQSEKKRRQKEQQILLQLGLIVGSFVVGFVPRTGYHFYSLKESEADYSITKSQTTWWVSFIAYFMLRLSECFNPIFYNVSSRKIRKETKRIFQKLLQKVLCKKTQVSPHTISTATTGHI